MHGGFDRWVKKLLQQQLRTAAASKAAYGGVRTSTTSVSSLSLPPRMGQARPAGVCSFIQHLNYHNKTIDRPSLSRARTLSTVCEERVRRSVAILMTALCGGGGTTGAASSYIAGVTLLTRRPSGRSMRYVNQYSTARACSSSTTTDGRICGTGPRLLCFALLACMHCARGASTPTAVPSRANQTPLAIMVHWCWSGQGPVPVHIHGRMLPSPSHANAAATGTTGARTGSLGVAVARTIPSDAVAFLCPIACLADLPSAAQSAAEGHMLVGMQCNAMHGAQIRPTHTQYDSQSPRDLE